MIKQWGIKERNPQEEPLLVEPEVLRQFHQQGFFLG